MMVDEEMVDSPMSVAEVLEWGSERHVAAANELLAFIYEIQDGWYTDAALHGAKAIIDVAMGREVVQSSSGMKTSELCWARQGGYGCTLSRGHDGGFHIASGYPIVSWPTDDTLAKNRAVLEEWRQPIR